MRFDLSRATKGLQTLQLDFTGDSISSGREIVKYNSRKFSWGPSVCCIFRLDQHLLSMRLSACDCGRILAVRNPMPVKSNEREVALRHGLVSLIIVADV